MIAINWRIVSNFKENYEAINCSPGYQGSVLKLTSVEKNIL